MTTALATTSPSTTTMCVPASEYPFPVYFGIPDEPPGIITICILKDGLYTMKKIMGGGYVLTKGVNVPNLQEGREKIHALPRLIPLSVFFTTAKFFRAVEKHFNNGNMEAYIVVGYTPAEDDFFLWVPEQEVGGATVRYDISKFHELYPESYIVMDIHSHTSGMGAFWSSTDDADDHRDRYSMVLGKINKPIPDHKIRFSSSGRRVDFSIEDLFTDMIEEDIELDIEDSLKRVTTYRSTYSSGYQNRTTAGYTNHTKEISTTSRHNCGHGMYDWDNEGYGDGGFGNEIPGVEAGHGRVANQGTQHNAAGADTKKPSVSSEPSDQNRKMESEGKVLSASITRIDSRNPTWFPILRKFFKESRPSIRELIKRELA